MDEQGDVGPARTGVSESAVSVNVVEGDGTSMGSLNFRGNVDEQSSDVMYEEDEIMVEVVGSDVFVDGVQQGVLGEEGSVRQIGVQFGGQLCGDRSGAGVEGLKEAELLSDDRVGNVMEMDAITESGMIIEPVNLIAEVENISCKTDDKYIVHEQATDVHSAEQEIEVVTKYPVDNKVESSIEAVEGDHHSVVSNDSKTGKIVKPGGSIKLHQSGYLQPQKSECHFAASDLVWGKVRSHPWWPGRICDPADASEKAVKHSKKGSYLVAYYGDGTFAWNDASVLKPFRSQFSRIEKLSNSEAFQSAVCCALEEVHRRVELGLTCSCIPQDVYDNLECEVLENAGIREESSKQYVNDKSCSASSFEPDTFVDYIRSVAVSATSRVDRLDLSITQAQLSAYCRFKGYSPPPEYVFAVELLENNADLVNKEIDDKPKIATSRKRKHDLNDSFELPTKKERNSSPDDDDDDDDDGDDDGDDDDDYEESDGEPQNEPTGRKRKRADSLADISDKKVEISSAIASATTPKPSFRIGECIRRVASQLTDSASIKSNSNKPENDDSHKRGNIVVPLELPPTDSMLLQLHSVAQNPRGQSLLNNSVSFFSSFRNSVVSGNRSNTITSYRKRKTSQTTGGTAEDFEFDDINDSYWTDMTVQNEGDDGQLDAFDPEKSVKSSRRLRKRISSSSRRKEGKKLSESDKKKRDMSPTELIVNFSVGSLPSEINLNKVFRRFGTLKEAETEIDHESRRARVVFRRGSDAEIAYNSSTIFSIFGSAQVTYQLSYSPSSFAYKPLLPLPVDANLVDACNPSPPATDQNLVGANGSSPRATDPTDPSSEMSNNPSSATDPNMMEPFESSCPTSHKPSPPSTDPNLIDMDIPPPVAEPNSVEAT